MVPRPLHRAGLAVLALAFIAAGCSSGGSDASTASTAAAPTTTAAGGGGGTGKALARYADYQSVNHDDPAHWVCRPDKVDDICDRDLDATVVQADGTLTVEPFEKAKDPPIDCFYVYPTISRDKTPTSDWNYSDDEEGYVTLNQAARLQSQCRLYAPVYRQATLTALTSRMAGGSIKGADRADPYADVLDAWRTYMANDNHGRGVVLIGHSQGTGMLSKLLKEEIDPNADVREQLVGAYLAGGSVEVPKGKAVGGDLQHVPVCTKDGEAGCVVTWVTFRSTAPPPSGSFFGQPGDGGQVAACVNPAAIGGGSADLDAYLPANSDASILSSLGTTTAGKSWVEPSAGKITTPFVRLPKLVSGECQTTSDGIDYLSATLDPDTDGPRADDIPGDLTPEWGLHLVNINLVMGNIVDDVAAQAQTYAHG
ncbi:DUF3089 domain-containing protein [Aquihabitans sp. McL0605]|uniref:DUF3089 domain-containing protein n=1 Tax=Aquihabitans sp. McL0605 TaxID=3415671 RepID=UPI003CEE6CBC